MVIRWLLVAGLLAGLAAFGGAQQSAFACHPDRLFDKRVNLDGDRVKEEVIAVDHHNCAHTEWRAYVHVRDRCRGAWRTYDLGSESDILQQFRIVNADGRTRRPEVFFVTRKVSPIAEGVAEVVRLDDRKSGCASVHELFYYKPSTPGLKSFDVELKDLVPKFQGLELVLTEGREVAQRITKYRYDRVRDRYVVYA